MRLEARADLAAPAADLYAFAADLRKLPAWWIEHLSAEVTTPARRSRDAIYRVRYRPSVGPAVTAACTVVAMRPPRSLTYVWDGGGIRMAIGQSFGEPGRGAPGCRTALTVDLALGHRFDLLGPIVARMLRRSLPPEMQRALATLESLVAAGTVMRRGSAARA